VGSSEGTANQRKHGISFDDAMHVFEDPYALFEPDRVDESGELRWRAPGLAGERLYWSWPIPFAKKAQTR
jgi:uncharacterized DUF497 family protein